MSSKYTRQSAIVAATPAATMVDKEGYGVTLSSVSGVLTATIGASATVIATGIILEGAATTGKASIGIIGALAGPVRVKLGGAVSAGAALCQHTDGSWVTDPASGGRVKSFIALEDGASGQLIEAANLTPVSLS
jgi:hypothetical protein